MKKFTKKGVLQKTIVGVLIVLCINFIVPTYSHADWGGVIFDPISDLLCSIGDAVINLLQKCMTGDWASGFKLDGGFLIPDDEYDKWSGSGGEEVDVENEFMKGWLGLSDSYYIPVATYSPEQIFAGEVPGLDINFIDPKFSEAEGGSAAKLQGTIANWYVALRNLAIVGLLSVLVYVGIRIIISSTASTKAKYKQLLVDWLIALCLLFFMHYIMTFTITMVNEVTQAIKGSEGYSVTIDITSGRNANKSFQTNLLGSARFKTQYKDFGDKVAYLIMYIALVVYTVIFTWFYLKRLLMMAFLTMIAPLVALTYPIDKIQDGKAQAFNSWIREYIFNALIQPFHLIIYMVFVGSAMELATHNIIYMIAALGFILPAEKILRGFFGFNKAGATLGGLVGATALGSYLGKGAKALGGGSGGSKGGSPNTKQVEGSKPVRFEKGHSIGQIEGDNIPTRAIGAGDSGENDSVNAQSPISYRNENDTGTVTSDGNGNRTLELDEGGRVDLSDQRILQEQAEQFRKQEEQERREEEAKQRALQDTNEQNIDEKLHTSRLQNWTRAHNITPKGVAKAGWRGIKGVSKFATRTTFKAGAGTLGAAIALASGGGAAGAAAAFAVGSSLGGKAANIAIKVPPTVGKVGKGVARVGGTAVGLVGAAGTGIREGIKEGSIGAGREAATNSKGMEFARRAAFEGSALGRQMDIANGNKHYQQLAAIREFKNNEQNIQYLKDQMAENGWTDINGKEYVAGSIPTDADVRDKMDSFDEYIEEGMTDVKQIMRAQKAEDYGVSAKQAAIISSLAAEKGITEEVLNDEKKFNAKRNNLIHEHTSKGYSEAEAQKRTDYILDVAKVQNGVANNMQKVPKVSAPKSEMTSAQKKAQRRAERAARHASRQVRNKVGGAGNTGANAGMATPLNPGTPAPSGRNNRQNRNNRRNSGPRNPSGMGPIRP